MLLTTTESINSESSSEANIRGCLEAEATLKDSADWNRILYIALPEQMMPEGSREALIALLEAAEEQLRCQHVIVVFSKDRSDRAMLVRTFMFLGFSMLSPNSSLVPPALAAKNVCMLYNME